MQRCLYGERESQLGNAEAIFMTVFHIPVFRRVAVVEARVSHRNRVWAARCGNNRRDK